MGRKPIDTVLEEHTGRLLSISGVVGAAHGEEAGEPCVRVFVASSDPELLRLIPSELEGYRVVVQETGELRAREP